MLGDTPCHVDYIESRYCLQLPTVLATTRLAILWNHRCSTSNSSTCSTCSPIDQFLSLPLPHSSRQHLLLALRCSKTAPVSTNADELRLSVLALEQSRPDSWVRPTHTRDCGLRKTHGLCVVNYTNLLRLACLPTASPS